MHTSLHPQERNDPCVWILRADRHLLIGKDGRLPTGRAGDYGTAMRVGDWHGLPCLAADVETLPESTDFVPTSLRETFALAGEALFALAGRALQLLDWRKNHRFCGHCGSPTQAQANELAMRCPSCGLLAYPRISPAIMVLVRRSGRLLLARSPRFKPGVYSALAGFVEAGETLEQCTAREVREEVGIEITNLRYFASQSWPFPNSLMVAFFADYAGGELVLDPVEIEAAAWFSPTALPDLPEPISISRQLIDAALAELRHQAAD